MTLAVEGVIGFIQHFSKKPISKLFRVDQFFLFLFLLVNDHLLVKDLFHFAVFVPDVFTFLTGFLKLFLHFLLLLKVDLSIVEISCSFMLLLNYS